MVNNACKNGLGWSGARRNLRGSESRGPNGAARCLVGDPGDDPFAGIGIGMGRGEVTAFVGQGAHPGFQARFPAHRPAKDAATVPPELA